MPTLGHFLAFLASATASVSAQSAVHDSRITLRVVLDSVRLGHPLSEAARARVRAARGSRTTAGALGNPILSYDVENAPFPGRELVGHMQRENMTTVMLPLESVVQRFPRAQRANAELRATEADANSARQRLALDAARTYYRTALAQVGVEAARDLAAWLDSVVAYNRLRAEEGVAAEADLIRTELERDRALADAAMQEAELARARAELSTFVGVATIPAIGVAVDSVPLAMTSTVTDASAVLSVRPDIRAARQRVSAAGAGVATERSMIVRQLGVTFGAKQSAGTTSMLAGFSIPLPIFDPNRGEIARASAERDVAGLELAAVERSARAELLGAYEAARLLSERAVLLARSVAGRPAFLARADEARHIALGAYREGAVPLLQVIDAARAWGDARVAFYRTLYAQHESIALLLVARGDDLFTALPALAAR
ncbi:MAG: TolC family protein [Gemmatimonadaceae bacterium]